MALPSSGPLSIDDIRTELGSSSGSLRTLSAAAGKSTPDAISEFYGYSSGGDDGKYQILTGNSQVAKLSSDYGSSFPNLSTVTGTNGVAISGNGQYILVGGSGSGGNTFLSSDYGANFSATSLVAGATSAYDISESGRYMIAGVYPNLYVSTDYGASWSNKLGGDFRSVSISRNGQNMFAALYASKIYYSQNFGASWSDVSNFGNRAWASVATTETQGHFIAGDNYWLWKTTDNGATNTKILAGMGGDIHCAISGDGQYIAAAVTNFSTPNGHRLYYSLNGGVSFGTHFIHQFAPLAVAMSLTGQYQLSVWDHQFSSTNRIYFSDDYGATITIIASAEEYKKTYVSRSTQ